MEEVITDRLEPLLLGQMVVMEVQSCWQSGRPSFGNLVLQGVWCTSLPAKYGCGLNFSRARGRKLLLQFSCGESPMHPYLGLRRVYSWVP